MQYASWQWIFYINLPIGVVASIILAVKLHLPKHTQTTTKIDYLGSIFVTAFTALTLLIVTLGGQQVAWHSAKMLYMIVGAVVALVAYLVVEHRMQKDALTPLPLFKNFTFNNASLQFALATAALFVAMVFIPMYAQMIHHVSASHSGYYIIPTMIAMILATMIGGVIIERTGKYKWLPIIGAVLLGVGYYGLAQISMSSSNWFIILWQIPVGLGVGLFVQVSMLAGQNTVPVRDLGTATGVLNFFKTLGGAFGAAAFGVVLTNDMVKHLANPIHAFQTVFIWTMPIALVLLVLAVFLKEEPLSEEVLAYED